MISKNPILQLLFPEKCLLCNKILRPSESLICDPCRQDTSEVLKLKRRIPFLSGAFALWYYEGKVRYSLIRYKFWGRRGYSRQYGALLAAKLQDLLKQYDLIVWVPVSKWRRLKRGYDQVELIAYELHRRIQATPTVCLKKIRHNPPQSGLASAAQRRANVLGVYKVPDPAAVSGKRILLLDDIITTGATISECAKMLMAAGAKEVYGVAVAVTREEKLNQ